MSVTIEDIRAAAERIRPIAHRTPVLTSKTFNTRAGVEAYFKCENLQRGGAFKIRGAANFIYSIPKEDLARGVVAFSSGNHAQAVAIAAASVNTSATIVMPLDAPKSKLEATRGYGAKVVTYDRFREDREAIGRQLAEETGATLVPPYDHPSIIAGQGTAVLELLEEVPDLHTVVVCIGGGGLFSGSAIAAHAMKRGIRIFGVEPVDGNDTLLSYRAGHRVSVEPPQTIADGLRASQPGGITFPIVQEHAEDIVTVSDDEIREMARFFLTRMKIVVEPSGAVAPAAVLCGKLPSGLGRTGIVLSGGNADLEFFQSLGD